MIDRVIKSRLVDRIDRNKAHLIFGPRRVGKTVLLQDLLDDRKHTKWDGENTKLHAQLADASFEQLQQMLGNTTLLAIDEAQVIPNIGRILKILLDTNLDLSIVATGSSALDLHNHTGEPLVGRRLVYRLHPLSEAEIAAQETYMQRLSHIDERLVYGTYPEVYLMKDRGEKREYLNDIIDNYLLRDVLSFDGIRNANKIMNLLRLVALQVGSQVSMEQLGKQLQISKNTVDKYLDILTKLFILIPLRGYSSNKRKGLTKMAKYYFTDNGIRNALISQFQSLELRNDVGILWENFLVTERIKHQDNYGYHGHNYFWRQTDGQELDWIEEYDGQLHAFRFKYNPAKQPKRPVAWGKSYPDQPYHVITKDNYFEWLVPPKS